MAKEPGRLYRKLDWLPKPLFALQTNPLGNVTDEQISRVIITRGKSDNSGGVNPSTMEVQLGNNKVGIAGNNIGLIIRSAPAAALIAKVGGSAEETTYIAPRFRGRLGKQSMDDRGDKKLPLNTIMSASWSAQLSYSPDFHALPSGTNVLTLLQRILRPGYLASRITVLSNGSMDSTFGEASGTYSDLVGPFASDIGILIRDRRDGSLEVLPMPYRRDRALAGMATATSLTRSQALSPAQWVQPNEMPAIEYRLKYRDADNIVKTIVTSPTGEVTGTAPVEDLDWTYFRAYTDQWRYIHAMRASSFDDRFRIETVTVDLIHLLSSPWPYHWDQAINLLKLEVGAPVYFGMDWPTVLQGIHFAEGIKETIDKDTWEITLNLIRFREITGEEASGMIPARVWDQAVYAWDTESRKWDES